MPGGDPMGGMGGAPGGMGGAPGGMDGGMGGGMGGGAAGGMGGAPGGMGGGMGAAASAVPDKIYKPGSAPKKKEEEVAPVQPQAVYFTKPEMKIYGMLQQMEVPYPIFAQFQQPVPGQKQPYVMDFAFPQIGIDIEADGEAWHEDEEDVERDKQRDLKLAAMGWRVLRFPEAAINERIDEIQKVVYDNILEAINEKNALAKKAQSWNQQKYEVTQTQSGDLWRSITVTKGKIVYDSGIKEA
jgi:very-short-patch-repair endonuclease